MGCGAFSLDVAASTCELGEGLDLPGDEVDSGGKEVFACKGTYFLQPSVLLGAGGGALFFKI